MAVQDTASLSLTVDGEELAARAIDKTADSFDKLDKAATSTKKSVDKSTDALKKSSDITVTANAKASDLAGTFGKFGPVIGLAAQGMTGFGGATGKVVQVVGTAAASVASLGAAFGPLGVAVAAVTAAFTAYQFVADSTNKRMQEGAQRARDYAEAFREQMDALSVERRAQAANDEIAAEERRNELLNSRGGLQERIRDIQRDINNLLMEDGRLRLVRTPETDQRINELEAERARLIEQLGNVDRPRREGGGRSERPAQPTGSVFDFMNAPGLEADRTIANLATLPEGYFGAGPTEEDIDRQMRWEELQIELNRINEEGNKIAEQKAKDRDKEIEDYEIMIGQVERYAGVVGGGMVDAISAALKGEMSLGAAIKKMIGDRLVALGKEEAVLAIVDTAKGFAALGSGKYDSAGQFFTAAATHVAAAAAAGTAGAIVSSAGGGGGGGGSVTAQPTRDTSAQATSGSGDRVINISFGSPVVTATTIAELGRELKNAIVTAENRGWA